MASVKPPGLERFGPVTLVGVHGQHNPAQDIRSLYRSVAAQWDDYVARRIAPNGDAGRFHYGVFHRMADGATAFEYFCGALNEPKVEQPADFVAVTIPRLYCAVFQHTANVIELRSTLHDIFGKILPLAGLQPAPDGPGVPEFIERYDARFDPVTGNGGLEILVPLRE